MPTITLGPRCTPEKNGADENVLRCNVRGFPISRNRLAKPSSLGLSELKEKTFEGSLFEDRLGRFAKIKLYHDNSGASCRTLA